MPQGPAIACTSHSFGIVPLEAAFRIIRALGIEHVDLVAATYPQQLDPYALAAAPDREAERIGNLANEAGVRLSACFVGFKEHLTSQDPSKQRRLAELLEAIGQFCARSGIPYIQTGFGRADPTLPAEEQFAIIVENVQAAIAAVRRAPGLDLLLEAQRGAAIRSPDETWQLLRAIPSLRINHDPGQFACQSFPQDTYESLYTRTGHIHMRQARPEMLQEKLEQGSVD
ncbi:MAG: TIM barrel protein, partial [Solirubrobacterales bacterium]|nr:TIM barrel protein [Solirubrobacterales bacterium]